MSNLTCPDILLAQIKKMIYNQAEQSGIQLHVQHKLRKVLREGDLIYHSGKAWTSSLSY